jgi:hypothetical protein
MKKLTKALLAIALVAFVAGIAEGSRPGGWGLGVPMGAVFLGLFFITRILGKESARFDEDERVRQDLAERDVGASSRAVSK